MESQFQNIKNGFEIFQLMTYHLTVQLQKSFCEDEIRVLSLDRLTA